MAENHNPFPVHHWAQQSPINLVKHETVFVKFPKNYFKADYRNAPYTGRFIEEHGHKNFVLDSPSRGTLPPKITVGNVEAELIKIHVHTPSEHDVDGHDLAGEIHLIHRILNPQMGSELIVLGVFFAKLKTSVAPEFFKMWASGAKSNKSSQTYSIDPRKLLPNTAKWFRYEGSLTTAPYSEIVSWLVFKEPIGIGSSDLKKLVQHAHQPEREVQPINRRIILRSFS